MERAQLQGAALPSLIPAFIYPVAVAFGVLLATENRRELLETTRVGSALNASRLALRQCVFAAGAVFSVVVMSKDQGMSRMFLLAYFTLLGPVLVLLNRHQPCWIAWRFLFGDRPLPTLIIGGDQRFPHFASWLSEAAKLNIKPVGCLSYRGDATPSDLLPSLGGFDNIERVMAEHKIGQVVMLDQPESTADADRVLRACLATGSRLLIHNNFGYKLGYPLQMVQESNYSYFTLHDEPLEEPLNRALKRSLDIGVSLVVLGLILPPLALIVAVMQRIQSPGPLFYAQARTGRNRSCFMILKFRSMHVTEGNDARQASPSDERVFPFGRFLRRTSLDEIPQFINVLRGEMSTVGPRPHLLAHSDAFSRDLDVYYLRYFAKPGITGLAQCNGFRGETRTTQVLRDRVQLDLEYIRTWSLGKDLWIILKTAVHIFFPPRTAV